MANRTGIGIAGPTLAYWLKAAGYEPTLVERAPALREGGYLPGTAPPSPELMQREKAIDDARRSQDDPALRNANEVTGYHILASNGEIGHVEDFLVEDDDWSIHYLVVDTKNWWPGRKVLISPMSVRKIEWADRRVTLGADCQKVKDSPAYDPSTTVDPLYEKTFHKHYGDLRLREAS